MSARVTLLPSARRLIDSLRDIGYDLPGAIADLVDNSISAGAQNVALEFHFDGADSWISIADDGIGMSARVLEEAMRYGSRRTYGAEELGRYGLGLKTASLSQCRCLTVASRRSPERRRIEVRSWDLDHVARTNRWEVLIVRPDETPGSVVDPLLEATGTVVLWEGLDHILDYRYPDGAAARRRFENIAHDVRAHLEMVFHRFLSGEARRGPVMMTLDGEPLVPWDPFSREEPRTVALAVQKVAFPGGGEPVVVRPFILPTQQTYSSADAHQRAGGPGRWNRQQGFYFYRYDRLVQAGGWSRLRTVDEHTKLARVAVEIPERREEEFGLDVAKMRVRVPVDLRGPFLAIATGVASEAGSRYRSAESGRRDRKGEPAECQEIRQHSDPALLPPGDLSFARAVIDVILDELQDEPDVRRRLLTRVDAAAVQHVMSSWEVDRPQPLSGRLARASLGTAAL